MKKLSILFAFVGLLFVGCKKDKTYEPGIPEDYDRNFYFEVTQTYSSTDLDETTTYDQVIRVYIDGDSIRFGDYSFAFTDPMAMTYSGYFSMGSFNDHATFTFAAGYNSLDMEIQRSSTMSTYAPTVSGQGLHVWEDVTSTPDLQFTALNGTYNLDILEEEYYIALPGSSYMNEFNANREVTFLEDGISIGSANYLGYPKFHTYYIEDKCGSGVIHSRSVIDTRNSMLNMEHIYIESPDCSSESGATIIYRFTYSGTKQ